MKIYAKKLHEKKSTSFILASTLFMVSALTIANIVEANTNATLVQTVQGNGIGNPAFGDLFGEHVTSNDDWVVMGAPRASVDLDNNGTIDRPTNAEGKEERQVGAVYIYKRTSNGLVLHQTVPGFGNSNNGNGDRFGSGVTLVGDELLIGAANDTSFPDNVDPQDGGFFFAGKVYIYQFNKGQNLWVKSNNILSSDEPVSNGAFGTRTDANRMISFPKHNAIVIAESGNSDQTSSKIHVFKKQGSKWIRTQIITSARTSEPANLVGLGDRAVRAGNSHLLLSEWTEDEINLLVYKFNKEGNLSSTPVQSIPAKITPLKMPTSVKNTIFDNFGIPDDQRADLSFLFDDNQIFCDGLLGVGGPLAGMAAAKNTVVVGDHCATSSGQYNELYGAVSVYTLNENSSTPLTLKQIINGPTDSLYYGAHFAGGVQTIATDGDRIVIGTATFLDPFGFEVQNYPVIDEPEVDVYKLVDGKFTLSTSIPSPDPSIDNGGLGSFYGISSHFLNNDDQTELLISNGGVGGNGGGKVYRFILD